MLHSEGAGRGADSEMKMNKYNIPRDKEDDLKVRDAGKYDRDTRIGVSINEDNGQAEPLDTDDPFEILARKQDALEAGVVEDDQPVPEIRSWHRSPNAQKPIRKEENAVQTDVSLPTKPVPTTVGMKKGLDVTVLKQRKLKKRLGTKPKSPFEKDWRKTA